MGEGITKSSDRQAVVWEGLEGLVRAQLQHLLQGLLEAEVTELLGRASRSGGRRWTLPPATATASARPGS